MLTPADDYPIHQTADPVAHPSSGDRNHYDRYFFNGHTRDGSLFFAAAMGFYPNRQVVDGAFSVVHDGVQRSVLASGRIPLDRQQTSVGPVRIEVVEPLRVLRLVVDDRDGGIQADLRYTARSAAWQEPRFTRHAHHTRLTMDYTRLTQWGRWSGWIEVDGERHEITPAEFVGVRDRSWGIRSVGEPEGGVPPSGLPQFYWLWAPLHFDDRCVHFAFNDSAGGIPWYSSGVVLPDVGDGPTWGPDAPGEEMGRARPDVVWRPGTRRADRARLSMEPWRDAPFEIELEPLAEFQMRGVGYFHPGFRHGSWIGEQAVTHDTLTLAELDPLEFDNLHIQAVVRARLGDQVGVGVLEQLVIGPHEPSGFQGLADGA